MERERVGRIHLAYFGTASPEAYGIDYRKVVRVHDFAPELPTTWPQPGDHLAVSANLLYGLYYDTERWLAEGLVRRGAVAEGAIRRWLDLRRRLSDRGERHPGLAEWLVAEGLTDAATVDAVSAELLSSRLARVREELTPIARAGDSILIYRLP